MARIRIDKFLADHLNMTRSKATEIIKKKQVTIDGVVVSNPSIIVDGEVHYLGNLIESEEYSYYILNKPKGYISARTDNLHKSVLEIINGRKDLKIVGRLDIDTTGLLIITNDGDFIHKVTSPKSEIIKKYYVKVDKPFKREDINLFEKGLDIKIDDTIYHTKPAKLEIIDDMSGYISISEGKFHQVKKMCASIGLEVLELKRIQIGGLELDSTLKEGEFKKVDISELSKIFI